MSDKIDAARYRWLRCQQWDDRTVFVVDDDNDEPHALEGATVYTRKILDAYIDRHIDERLFEEDKT